MRVIVIGGTGTIGSAVAHELEADHEVLRVGRSGGERRADITSRSSLERLYREVGDFGAVVCAAGEASFGDLVELDEEDFALGLRSKLMGQINVVRAGLDRIADGGSFTLTSGVLAAEPIPGSAAISPVNAGVEAFARAAALELDRGLRVNVVSPPWVAETLEEMGRDPSEGMPAAEVARAYLASVRGEMNGEIIDARTFG
jgi:NAD(P)-dependent dehydrogenase (short-subunit alcohol dehydrogenase family)